MTSYNCFVKQIYLICKEFMKSLQADVLLGRIFCGFPLLDVSRLPIFQPRTCWLARPVLRIYVNLELPFPFRVQTR